MHKINSWGTSILDWRVGNGKRGKGICTFQVGLYFFSGDHVKKKDKYA